MRGGVHCLLPSTYRRHATRRMRGAYPYCVGAERYPSDTRRMSAHLPARPLMKSEGAYTGAVVGGEPGCLLYIKGTRKSKVRVFKS